MKKASLILALLFCLPLVASAQTYSTNLSGDTGAGVAIIMINGTTVQYQLLVGGVTPTSAVITQGAGGSTVVDLSPSFTGGNATGSVASDSTTVNAIVANPAGYYVSINSGALTGRLAATGAKTLYFPVVGAVSGQNDTKFITDIRVINPGDEEIDLTMTYFRSTGASSTVMTTVGPGAQLSINDVIGGSFQADETLGALAVTGSGNFRALVRIINDQRPVNAGTGGFAMDALDPAAAGTSGTLPFLSDATDFRTNVGWYNPSNNTVMLTLTARSKDGTELGARTVAVGPNGIGLPSRWSSVITSVTQTTQEDFFITWESDAPIFVYATTADNVNGDNVLVQ